MAVKRTSSILIISLLIATLAGCGGGSSTQTISTNTGSGDTGVTGSLTWDAPTTYTDGSTIADLAGYKIYYGTTPGNYTGSINVAGRDSTSLPITTLAAAVPAPGTYYIALTAYDAAGLESDLSNEVSKTL